LRASSHYELDHDEVDNKHTHLLDVTRVNGPGIKKTGRQQWKVARIVDLPTIG
jgi:hypothetical protein